MANLPDELNLGCHPKTKVTPRPQTGPQADLAHSVQFSMFTEPADDILTKRKFESAIIVGIEVPDGCTRQKTRLTPCDSRTSACCRLPSTSFGRVSRRTSWRTGYHHATSRRYR